MAAPPLRRLDPVQNKQSLDRYEGYPRFYDKKMVTVQDGLGRSLSVRSIMALA